MRLSDICSFKNGKAIKITPEGKYPIVGSTGIIGKADYYLIEEPIVTIARVGAQCGYVQYINYKSWITDNTIICIPNEDYDAKYIYYLLSTININSLHIGAAQPLMTSSILKSIEVINHSLDVRQHIVNTIGSVDNLIENKQAQIEKICTILVRSLSLYNDKVSIAEYMPEIIKSGIDKFDKSKNYLDTSSIEGINNISSGEIIEYDNRPSRANMQPIKNSVWFAKMKHSNKILIITDNDKDILSNNILSTGFLGIKASKRLPLSLLVSIVISNDFHIQRDLNSVGTTMAGINNETFLKIQVPHLNENETKEYGDKYSDLVYQLSSIRREIDALKSVKNTLLKKYF